MAPGGGWCRRPTTAKSTTIGPQKTGSERATPSVSADDLNNTIPFYTNEISVCLCWIRFPVQEGFRDGSNRRRIQKVQLHTAELLLEHRQHGVPFGAVGDFLLHQRRQWALPKRAEDDREGPDRRRFFLEPFSEILCCECKGSNVFARVSQICLCSVGSVVLCFDSALSWINGVFFVLKISRLQTIC